MTSPSVNLLGPAGITYPSIADGGKHLLDTYCDKYPATAKSFILPPVFISEHTEGTDPITKQIPRKAGLTLQEERRVQGLDANLSGNETENLVYKAFAKLYAKQQRYPSIVLNTFHCNKDKFKAIKNDFPSFPSVRNLRELETDFLIMIKNVGLAFVEVKRDSSPGVISKAEKQLDKMSTFAYNLINAYNRNACAPTILSSFADLTSIVPAVKIIIVPNDPGKSANLIQNGCYHVYKDSLNDMENKWDEIVIDLENQLSTCQKQFTNDREFRELASLFLGLWALKSTSHSSTLREDDFDEGKASLSHLLKQTDIMVDEVHITSGKVRGRLGDAQLSKPQIDVVYNSPSSVFRSTEGINMFYLTPQQKHLFDKKKQCFVRGAAGTGKTILAMCKIIELIPTLFYDKILVVAPFPHNIRCKNFFEDNNIRVYESTTFPPPPTILVMSCDVILMQHSHFFCEKLLEYDLSNYHVFMDDVHACIQESNGVSYTDVRNFFTQLHVNSCHDGDMYRWVLVDVMQDSKINNNTDLSTLTLTNYAISIFYDDQGHLVQSFPIMELSHVLRNSVEICEAVMEGREGYQQKMHLSAGQVNKAQCAHNIHGKIVEQHILTQTTTKPRDLVTKPFVKHVPTQILKILLQQTTHTTNALQLDDIVIFNPTETIEDVEIKNMLLEENIRSGNVEEQLRSRDSMVAIDDLRHVNSAEWAFVVMINDQSELEANGYTLFSRARSGIFVVDSTEYSTVLECDERSVIIQWKETN